MKNIVVIPAVQNKELDKFGGWSWMEYSISAWKYWCSKNNCELVIYDTTNEEDISKYRITWQRWFDVFDFLDKKQIKYDKVLMTDACSIPKWDCDNFFELVGNNLTATYDMDNLGWIYKSVQGYKNIFDGYELDIMKYINAGFVIFNKSHRSLFQSLKEFYYKNLETILELETKVVRKGTDQTPLNYFLQTNNINVDILPMKYRMSHLHRKDLLTYNWQLNEDQTPYFIKYASVWVFSGFDKTQRNHLMQQTWNLVKDHYE
jgi:hypothetical protein